MFRLLAQHLGKCMLRRAEGAEHVVLMHFAQLGRQRQRRDAVAHLPAGAVVGLAETGHHERPLAQGRGTQHGFVADAVEHNVLVHLIRQQPDAGIRQQVFQLAKVIRGQHRPGRIVWGVDDQHPRLRGHGGADPRPVRRKRLRIQRHVYRAGAGQLDRRVIAVVGRVKHDHLFTRPHHRMHCVEDRLGRAAGHGDLGLRIHLYPVHALHLGRDRLAQRRHPGHRRVLVVSVAHCPGQGVNQPLRYGEIRKPLPQIDRIMARGQLRHDGEDRGAHLGQFAVGDHLFSVTLLRWGGSADHRAARV